MQKINDSRRRPGGCAGLFYFAAGLLAVSAVLAPSLAAQRAAQNPVKEKKLEITRPARPWEFLAAVGKKSGLLGNESGKVEAWVYPLKILRDFKLTFRTEGREIPAETLVRTIVARPEATTLRYSGDTFSVRETFFAPVDQPGAVIEIQVETEQPLEVQASFVRDFQLEWPAAMGGTYVSWNDALHGFVFGEDHQKFAAIAGSPSANASGVELEYETNYGSSHTSSMKLGVTPHGKDSKIVVIAGSVNGRAEAEKTYQLLTADYRRLLQESAAFYSNYLQRTTGVELPDEKLQQAYDWSRVSLIQGLVSNPTMGDGLIAGYRTSGEGYRPGFAWFFGRDSLWCDMALDSEGDFATTKTALEFIAKFQREDGKIPHEIAQGASFVDWFKGYPYAFSSADATPLFMVGVDDYVTASGDVEFAKANWEHVRKAYEFVRSTYDASGYPKNFGIGHGWVEGGPLLPVESEFYQNGAAVAAIRSLAHLAELTGKSAEAATLRDEFEKERKRLNEVFWSPEKKMYAFAVDRDGKRVDEATVLTTVPMWLDVTDEAKSQPTIEELAKPEHQADWGMRIISNKSVKYSGGGYHYGSVWPLFTGWASVAEYRNHAAQPAYDNLRANALLALDGSPGHVTEVLSGDFYQPLSTSSPHQIWSAAMVVSPVLRGMFGLHFDAQRRELSFSPHVPAGWTRFGIQRVAAGKASVNFDYSRDSSAIELNITRAGDADLSLTFSPAVSPRAQILGVTLNGKNIPFQVEPHGADRHVTISANISQGENQMKIQMRNDFAVTIAGTLPSLGASSEGLRILSQTWSESGDSITLQVAGLPGRKYLLALTGKEQIKSMQGAQLHGDELEIGFPEPSEPSSAQTQAVTIHFSAPAIKTKTKAAP